MTRGRILVVEELAPIARLLDIVLTRQGYEVCWAQDGQEALALLPTESWALVLLDWQMPRVSGEEVLAQMRADERTRTLPVIVLSGGLRNGQRVPGASAVMAKPFSITALLAVISSVMTAGPGDPAA